jgi:formylglycine-generating enzyme required for sulfatase activity
MFQTRSLTSFLLILTAAIKLNAQQLDSIISRPDDPFRVHSFMLNSGIEVHPDREFPLLSFRLNEQWIDNNEISTGSSPGFTGGKLKNGLEISCIKDSGNSKVLVYTLRFSNKGSDTLNISNILPFGNNRDHLFITADGPPALARAKLFRQGFGPVDVTLPDNAWDLGYASVETVNGISLYALTRRHSMEGGIRRRYANILPPGSSMEYKMYLEAFSGNWQAGLKKAFHEHYLFDLIRFDDALYQREDLTWIRDKYIMTIQFAWDHNFYDLETKKFNFYSFLEQGKNYFGGYDIFALWPTWPRLGLDQRNQFDLYSSLPYGLPKLKELSNYARFNGTRFFISYNPWDNSTRPMNHLEGMAALIKAVDADGVVLDTRGNSSWELQAAADSVRDGVIMYSEGMAIPRDMPGIIAGRVHDAIFFQPPLNLNKLIRPDFAIFRVCQLSQGRIHREIAISFFNGYGTEINTMAPGRPDWIEEDFAFLSRTTRILRENSLAFLNDSWLPLLETSRDSIWVNQWTADKKTLYTIFSLNTNGNSSTLFRVKPKSGFHFVNLWDHIELPVIEKTGESWLCPVIPPFNYAYLGTRMEGQVSCIAMLPELIRAEIQADSVKVNIQEGNRVLVWNEKPSYSGHPKEFAAAPFSFSITEKFGRYEGPIIIQAFLGKELLDECIVQAGEGWIKQRKVRQLTEPVAQKPVGMVEIPAGRFVYRCWHDESFIPYPNQSDSVIVSMPRFFMDQYPVTNEQYEQFIVESGYRPADTLNYLHHWKNGTYLRGQGNSPVVWVSPEDAHAFAKWAGKRLPTEMEWQYAAQGTDGRKWPWGNEFHATKCNNSFGLPTPVDAFPKGKSPFQVEDMVGNVWQLTADEYDDGSYYFTIIRGGSFFNPESSEWYIRGGPQPVDKRQMLIRVSEGFDRNATIGFRCVRDARQNEK